MGIEQHLMPRFSKKQPPIPSIDFTGKWQNELGSEMELAVLANGRVSGTYRTGVGTPTPTEEFELVGFASGDLITFTVNFGAYDSLTAWSGQHTVQDGVEKIYTLWHMAKNIRDEDEPSQLWSGILAGANVFTRSGSQ